MANVYKCDFPLVCHTLNNSHFAFFNKDIHRYNISFSTK